MRFKKVIGLALMIVLAVGILVPTLAAGNPRTLRIITNTNGETERRAYGAVIEAFLAENPDVQVEYEAFAPSAYYQIMQTRVASDEVDLFVLTDPMQASATYWRPMIAADKLLDITEQPFLDIYAPDLLKGYASVDNRVYGIPVTGSVFVGFYNKDLFNELGIAGPPSTWNELMEINETLKTAGYTAIALGNKDLWPAILGGSLIASNVLRDSPGFFDRLWNDEARLDGPEYTKTMEMWADLIPYYTPGAQGIPYEASIQEFANGRAGMFIDGDWNIGAINAANPQFEVGVFALPVNEDPDAKAAIVMKSAVMVGLNTQNKDLAIRFLEFFSQPAMHSKFSSVAQTIPVVAGAGEHTGLVADIVELLDEHPLLAEERVYYMPGADVAFLDAFLKMYLEGSTPQEVAEWMQDRLERSKPRWER